jgi:hypothetical protein
MGLVRDGKDFFFVKKKKKTCFDSGIASFNGIIQLNKSFLLLFYKKEVLASCRSPV